MPIYYGGGGGNSTQGRIVKVHRNHTDTTTSSTSGTFNVFDDVITPTGSSNWFVIHWRVCMSHTTNNSNYMQLVIGGNVVGGRGGGRTTGRSSTNGLGSYDRILSSSLICAISAAATAGCSMTSLYAQ